MAESIVYLHGVPNHAEEWAPFLERTGGLAPDLPGFGKSEKPASGDYTFRGLARFVSEYTADMERFSLVMHDWGAVGLLAAMERPEAIERLVVMNAVPFLPGYRWHPFARMWRRPLVGELFMGFSTKWGFKQLALRDAGDRLPRHVVEEQVDQVWKHFDHGTQRAILRLYRSAPEDALAEAGRGLDRIKAPTLVVWGTNDPYLPTEFARAYADVLGGELELVDAGHWPWIERPEVIDRVAAFLAE